MIPFAVMSFVGACVYALARSREKDVPESLDMVFLMTGGLSGPQRGRERA